MPDPRPGAANKVPPILGDLLKASTQFTGQLGAKRSREQTVLAVMEIVRRKIHPAARLRRHADGGYTITIPPHGNDKALPQKG